MNESNCLPSLFGADISENYLWSIDESMFRQLLTDHTLQDYNRHQAKKIETDEKVFYSEHRNIFWASSDYDELGDGYHYYDEIKAELITGEHNRIVMPRVLKPKEQQKARSKQMAEVFTPAWICNAQNNLVDNVWLGVEGAFNVEMEAAGAHVWKTNKEKIAFPAGKTWFDYVCDTRMEMTCGEAPYLVSRYDATTGEVIPIEDRIGIIDRKLRVVDENVSNELEWVNAVKVAYMSTYGFEWQGDSLLLAREALLGSFIEYYERRFNKMPVSEMLNDIACIISWNLWQMDGFRMVIPCTCHDERIIEDSLFERTEKVLPCEGCQKNDYHMHNGIYCVIRDWKADEYQFKDKYTTVRFVDLLKDTK